MTAQPVELIGLTPGIAALAAAPWARAASRPRPGHDRPAEPAARAAAGSAIGLLLAALVFFIATAAGPVRAQETLSLPAFPPVAGEFSGEQLGYEVSFLFFHRAAIGLLSLEPEPAADPGAHLSGSATPAGAGRYVARASVETKGFVGWLNKRRHVYTSVLVPCEGGWRWCSRRFVMDLIEHDHREVRTTYVNPARRLVTWTIERDGVVEEIGWEPMRPGRHYDDLLAALYNFRAEAYGPIEPGRRYEIQTIPIKGVRSVTIRVLEGQEEAAARRKYELGQGGFVLAVEIPRAIFGKEVEIFAWLSPDLILLGGTVENYIGFGDVHGRLTEAVRPVGAAEAGSLIAVSRASRARHPEPDAAPAGSP